MRYWDYRKKGSLNYPIIPSEAPYLTSDARNRTDAIYLVNNPVEEAQAEKERLEDIQRNDRRLRMEAEQRRSKGGPKYPPRSQ